MRAAVLNSVPGDLDIEDVAIDKPMANEVLIQTHACGLCHSDLSVMEGGLPFPVPAVLGHEAAGVVTAVGADVHEFAVGDRVVGCLSGFCGTCRECVVGNTWLCEDRPTLQRSPSDHSRLSRGDDPIGQLGQIGGFAEEMLLHRNGIVTVPDEIPLDRAALLGCAVLTGVGSVFNGAKVQPGSTVAVIGAGGIGVNIIQGAILAGASRVIAVDLRAEKLELAKVFGATDVV
ncbi:MAG: alcohol dehydrogenase, partial [Acidimicrobiales bacterium]